MGAVMSSGLEEEPEIDKLIGQAEVSQKVGVAEGQRTSWRDEVGMRW